ncbi:cation transporter [Desulfonema ishimotonii]|uniref:Cation transporter n=2 Tax=Desulfonema ishimotonii TaxID=45657 RepID=A0A401FU06_9BACT|nr:cation transporter [Desulfonema ishimotonii]
MVSKFYVWRITGSSAILSDALESIINVVASAFALWSILMAARPPDEDHPYGHGKAEYFSAGFEGALIILAAVGIFKVGMTNILTPRPLPRLETGLLILLATSLVNLMLGLGLVRVGRQTRSLALIADGRHVLTDVYTSGGVLVGLFMVHLTGWYRLDGIIACLVGLNIIVSGVGLLRQSCAGLMDASDPELLDEIAALLIRNRRNEWIDIHRLRAWRSGTFVHIDFHLILHRETTLENAHRQEQVLENLINEHFGGEASLLIHLDPCFDGACPICDSQCILRDGAFQDRAEWSRETLVSQSGIHRLLDVTENRPETA